jgi:hypothetical protein
MKLRYELLFYLVLGAGMLLSWYLLPQAGPGINEANYHRIRLGTSYREVAAIIGTEDNDEVCRESLFELRYCYQEECWCCPPKKGLTCKSWRGKGYVIRVWLDKNRIALSKEGWYTMRPR